MSLRRGVDAARGASSGRRTTTLGLLAAVVVLASLAPVAIASDDAENSHTVSGVFHGWTRRHHLEDGGYHFHGWTEHGHGAKYAGVYHYNSLHVHCDNSGSADHVHCDAHTDNNNHKSVHEAPLTGGCSYSDGHGWCPHSMEPFP